MDLNTRFLLAKYLYMSLRGRYTFKGLSRYGSYSEKMYRLWFEKPFDFLGFNISLCDQLLYPMIFCYSKKKEEIVVFYH